MRSTFARVASDQGSRISKSDKRLSNSTPSDHEIIFPSLGTDFRERFYLLYHTAQESLLVLPMWIILLKDFGGRLSKVYSLIWRVIFPSLVQTFESLTHYFIIFRMHVQPNLPKTAGRLKSHVRIVWFLQDIAKHIWCVFPDSSKECYLLAGIGSFSGITLPTTYTPPTDWVIFTKVGDQLSKVYPLIRGSRRLLNVYPLVRESFFQVWGQNFESLPPDSVHITLRKKVYIICRWWSHF